MSQGTEPSREEQNKQTFAQPQQQLNKVSEQAGYDIPVESVPLPSGGRVYSVEHPLYNEERVDIKCMTAKEEDLITSRALIRNGTVTTKLIQSCMLNKMVDPDTLLTGDRSAILFAIRITGYGADYEARVTCGHCGEEYVNEFNLSNLPIKRLGAEPIAPNQNRFSFTLPLSKREVHFKLLTGAEEANISRAAKQKKKVSTQIESVVTSRLIESIISLGGETDRQKIVYGVQNMRAGDARALRGYIDTISPGIEMKQFATCEMCGEQSEMVVPLGLNFLWPDADI